MKLIYLVLVYAWSAVLAEGYVIHTDPLIDTEHTATMQDVPTFVGKRIFLLHIAHYALEDFHALLSEKYNTSIVSYIPYNSYVIYVSENVIREMIALDIVMWAGTLPEKPPLLVTHEISSLESSNSYDVIARLAQLSGEDLRGVTAEIEQTLKRALVPVKAVEVVTETRLLVTGIHRTKVTKTLETLSQLPFIVHAYVRSEVIPLVQFARPLLLSGESEGYRYSEHVSKLLLELGGDGQVIGVGDSGIDVSCLKNVGDVPIHDFGTGEPYFNISETNSSLVQYVNYADSKDSMGHGTLVAHILSGETGMAPKAKLAFFDIHSTGHSLQLPADLKTHYFEWAYLAGARVHSNSWGEYSSAYTSMAQDVDEFMWTHKDFIAVFSVGNSGMCSQKSTLLSPATSKSAIAVGASVSSSGSWYYAIRDSAEHQILYSDMPEFYDTNAHHNAAYFTSSGPTRDGRIKPDIMAPGQFIRSIGKGCGEKFSQGTSVSAPLISSSLILIREYLVKGYYPSREAVEKDSIHPSGSLLKALMLHSARALTGKKLTTSRYSNSVGACGADLKVENISDSGDIGHVLLNGKPYSGGRTWNRFQGFGLPQLDRILLTRDMGEDAGALFLAGHRNVTDEYFGDPFLRTNETHSYEFCVAPGADVAVTLVWTDYFGSTIAEQQLINDLDLRVTVGENMTFTVSDGKHSTADRINPMELLSFTVPEGPRSVPMKIEVTGATVPMGPQPYSLVVGGVGVHSGTCTTVTCYCEIVVQELGDLLKFNAFFWGDFYSAQSYVQGRLGVNGDIHMSQFSVGTSIALKNNSHVTFEDYSLVCNGNVEWEDDGILGSQYAVRGDFSAPHVECSGVSGPLPPALRDVLAEGKERINRTSQRLLTLNEVSVEDKRIMEFCFDDGNATSIRMCSGHYSVKYGGLHLRESPAAEALSKYSTFIVDVPAHLYQNLFYVSLSPFLSRRLSECDDALTVIFNIGGKSVRLISVNTVECAAHHFVWNLYEAEKVIVSYSSVLGTVLAPFGIIEGNGVVNGAMFARSSVKGSGYGNSGVRYGEFPFSCENCT